MKTYIFLTMLAMTASASAAGSATNVVVAVIDTGADVNHPALSPKLWTNAKENKNGVDDDGNGLVDDLNGWNFAAESEDLSDGHGHGTHIAGIVAEHGGDKVRLMILKYYDKAASSDKNIKATVAAIQYAIDHGAAIINYSSGGALPGREEELAIARAKRNGILFVAAAGNESSNSDFKKYFPAGYGFANILSVASFSPALGILPSSNFGRESVHLAAPGHNILSAIPGGSRGVMTGTSQATAHATSAAAKILAVEPWLTPEKVIRRITYTVDRHPATQQKTKSGGVLNMARALRTKGPEVTATGRASTVSDELFYVNF